MPVTALPMESVVETLVHPGGFAQNVLATGECWIGGTTRVAGREAIVVECDHPRTIEIDADRPDHHFQLSVDRETGVIIRLVETIAGAVTRVGRRHDPGARRGPPALRVRVHVPDRDDAHLLSRPAGAGAPEPARRSRWAEPTGFESAAERRPTVR